MSDIETNGFDLEGLVEIDSMSANQIAVFGLNRLVEDMTDLASRSQAECAAINIANAYARLRQAGQGNKWQSVKLTNRTRGPELITKGKFSEVKGIRDYYDFCIFNKGRPQLRHIREDIAIDMKDKNPAKTKRSIRIGGAVYYRQVFFACKPSTTAELIFAENLLRKHST
jgi:hypothetical protein